MELTEEQRQRIEENRLKAQAKLRQRRSMQHGPGTAQAAQRPPSRTAVLSPPNPTAPVAAAVGTKTGTDNVLPSQGAATLVTVGKVPSQARGVASISEEAADDDHSTHHHHHHTGNNSSSNRDGASASSRVESPPQGINDSDTSPPPPPPPPPPHRVTSSRVGGGRSGAARTVAPLTAAGTGSKFDTTPSPGEEAAGGNLGTAGTKHATAECEGCAGAEGDGRVDREVLEGFGVTICRTCKLSREEYQFISKKEAKDVYLLPEGTIAVLKFVERDNPHHSSWTKMKLYLRRDVMEYSFKRWGSEAALEVERGRREALKFNRSLARTKGVFKRAKAGHEDRHSFRGDVDDDE